MTVGTRLSGAIRAGEHEFAYWLALTWDLARQMLRRQVFLRSRASHGGHRLHGEIVRHVQRRCRPRVVETRHAVDDQSLHPSLIGHAHPRGSRVVRMRGERSPALLVSLLRDEDDECGGAVAPGFVVLIQQVEEYGPVRRV